MKVFVDALETTLRDYGIDVLVITRRGARYGARVSANGRSRFVEHPDLETALSVAVMLTRPPCSTPGCTHVVDTASCADGRDRCLFCALRASVAASGRGVAA